MLVTRLWLLFADPTGVHPTPGVRPGDLEVGHTGSTTPNCWLFHHSAGKLEKVSCDQPSRYGSEMAEQEAT